jgi:hypothetical protein
MQPENPVNIAVDIQNNLAMDGAVEIPVKRDGSKYLYCLYYDTNKRVVFSDSLDSLITRLIPDYLDMEEIEKETARSFFLRGYFARMQLHFLEEGSSKTDSLTEREWLYIMNPDKSEPRKSFFEKFNLLKIGNDFSEKVVSANTERSFLESLDRFNIISFYSK